MPAALIGFSSHCFPKNTEMERILDFCEEHAFNAMELNTNTQNFDLRTVKEPVLARIRRMADSGQVRFSLHPSDGVNFADPTPEGRRRSLDKTEEALRVAAGIGVAIVPIHPGQVSRDATPGQVEEGLSHTVAAIRRCAATARELGVGLSVENLCHVKGTVAPDIRGFMTMCETIGLSLIGMTLDTGHAALVDGLEQTVAAIGRHVNHIHLDDSSLLRSDHLELGTGKIDFPAIAEYLRTFDGMLNIELKVRGEDYGGPILRSREYLLRLLSGS
jgi:sugar phosphate isomerase/epimerase